MSGQVKKSEFDVKQKQMEKFIAEHSPYDVQSLGIKLHELVDYAKENEIPYNRLSECDIQKFKI